MTEKDKDRIWFVLNSDKFWYGLACFFYGVSVALKIVNSDSNVLAGVVVGTGAVAAGIFCALKGKKEKEEKEAEN